MSDGIKNPSWFEVLSPELKNEVVDYALGIIAAKTKFLEIGANGGDNDIWYKLTTAVAVSGAPHAEKIFVKHASTAKNADPEDELRQHFSRCQTDADGRITVGTLLGLALDNGADFDKWERQSPPFPPLPPEKRKPLKGGTYSRDEALELINSHYLIGKSDQEISILRIKDDGTLKFTPAEQFKLDVANIFIQQTEQKPARPDARPRDLPDRRQWIKSGPKVRASTRRSLSQLLRSGRGEADPIGPRQRRSRRPRKTSNRNRRRHPKAAPDSSAATRQWIKTAIPPAENAREKARRRLAE